MLIPLSLFFFQPISNIFIPEGHKNQGIIEGSVIEGDLWYIICPFSEHCLLQESIDGKQKGVIKLSSHQQDEFNLFFFYFLFISALFADVF